ncbi:MAG: hypothetical protein EXS02_12170 [Planctomycetes bacterium]|nr:hypothetical protein [Planctomycetota bacterium]
MPVVPLLLLLLACGVRSLVCLRTVVPGRDGAHYLWLAERCANGDFSALFGSVFHPGYPLLTAGVLRMAPLSDTFLVGQFTSAACAALAVVPLYYLSRALYGERAALWACLGYALGTWFCRHPAECMSEGPFYLSAVVFALALLRGRPAIAGVMGAIAYWVRPEGAALLLFGCVWLLFRRERRALFGLLLTGLPVAALLPLCYAIFGQGFTLSPKADFCYEVGVGQEFNPFGYYCSHLVKIPSAAFEGLGFVVLPLMLLGAFWCRPRKVQDFAFLLIAPLLLQCLVMPLLRSHYRFVSGLGILWFPFAGYAFVQILVALSNRLRALRWLCVLIFIVADVGLLQARGHDRIVEQQLGRWLQNQLGAEDLVASDMPTLEWYAGQKPPPPKPILAADILVRAKEPRCRFVLWVVGRTDLDPSILSKLGYRKAELPESLQELLAARPILVLTRNGG